MVSCIKLLSLVILFHPSAITHEEPVKDIESGKPKGGRSRTFGGNVGEAASAGDIGPAGVSYRNKKCNSGGVGQAERGNEILGGGGVGGLGGTFGNGFGSWGGGGSAGGGFGGGQGGGGSGAYGGGASRSGGGGLGVGSGFDAVISFGLDIGVEIGVGRGGNGLRGTGMGTEGDGGP